MCKKGTKKKKMKYVSKIKESKLCKDYPYCSERKKEINKI